MNNTIKTTLRYLWRNKLFTALNIVGLSIGISACWMVFSIVHYEFSFDKELPDAEHIYQIVSENEFEGEKSGFAGVPLGMAPLLIEESLDDAVVVPIYGQRFERLFIPQGDEEELVLDEQERLPCSFSASYKLANAKTKKSSIGSDLFCCGGF